MWFYDLLMKINIRGKIIVDEKEKEILEYNNRFMKKVLKSALYTLFVLLSTFFLVGFVLGLLFDGGDTSIIVTICIGIIFTIFYCTMTIIDEIKK